MKYILLLLFISNVMLYSVKAQDIEFKKKNFTDAKGFNEAINNIKKGDDYFNQQKKWTCSQALDYYLKANIFNPNNSMLNFKIGICYLNSSDKASSLNYFLKAQSLNPNVDAKIEYAIAQGYHYNLQFDNAIEHYKKFQSSYSGADKNAIDKKITECENGKVLVSKPIDVKIENISAVNSKYSDYAPLITANEKQIIFTSRREGSTGGEIDPNELEYYEDIYQSIKVASGWTAPVKINGNVNTSSHDASVGLSFDGTLLFIYRGLIHGGDLYEYTLKNYIWSQSKPLNKINTEFHETSACISADGKTLYLVSDRHDKTIGMRDIFVSQLQVNGEWGEPENIGEAVNTPYDEEGVSLSKDGKTLYFSSTGHNSMGGFDMFKSTFVDGKWTTPENLGYPLNTPDDDMYCQVFDENGNLHGYFSATRKEGLGSSDIYSFQMNPKQTALKNLNDSTDNPENYKVPVENGEPSNLFVNVKDSTKNEPDNVQKTVENKKDTTKNVAQNINKNEQSNVQKTVENKTDTIKNTAQNINKIEQNNVQKTVENKTDTIKNNAQNTNKNEPNNVQKTVENKADTTKNVVQNTNKNEQNNVQKTVVNKTDANKNIVQNTNKKEPEINKNDVQIANNENVYFKVQVGACHRQIPYAELHQRYRGKKDVIMEQHEGWYKYLFGKYDKYSQAKQDKLTCGTPDAWVVVYKNGQRVNISEVIKILSYYPFNKLLIAMLN